MAVEIKTSDLYFAAFLKSIGCEIVNVEQNGQKNIFFFKDPQERKNLKEIYFNEDQASAIPALVFSNAVRSLKTLCYVRS